MRTNERRKGNKGKVATEGIHPRVKAEKRGAAAIILRKMSERNMWGRKGGQQRKENCRIEGVEM